jgi:hypothetical protein
MKSPFTGKEMCIVKEWRTFHIAEHPMNYPLKK